MKDKIQANHISNKQYKTVKTVKTDKDVILCIAIPILIIVIYLINCALGYGNILVEQGLEEIKTTYISSSLLGLGTGLELVALMKLINRPVQSILFTLLSQLALMFSDLAQGYSFYESFANNGVIEIYFSLLAIGMLVMLWRRYIKQAKKLKERLALTNYIRLNRAPLKVPMWAIFSIICLGLNLVIALANEVEVGVWSDALPFRIYVGLTVFVPTLTTLAMYTASNLVYYFYGAMMALKLITVYRLIELGEFRWTILLICLIQLIVYVYSLIEYIAYRRVNSEVKKIRFTR